MKLFGWNQSETVLETYVTDLCEFNSVVLNSKRKGKIDRKEVNCYENVLKMVKASCADSITGKKYL